MLSPVRSKSAMNATDMVLIDARHGAAQAPHGHLRPLPRLDVMLGEGACCNTLRSMKRLQSPFIEKLTEAHCARAAILCVWIAIGLNRNYPFNE